MDKLFFEKSIENKKNDIYISLVNGLRRSIMCDIDVYCINMDDTIFYENTCNLDNEFLNKRLSLIPIISDYDDVIYENIRIECKIKNNSQDMKSVYFSDLEFKDDKEKVISKEFSYFPKTLFAKLKPNQSISFETRLTKNNSQYGGANYNPTCTCVHTFKIDENAIQNKIKEAGMNEAQSKSFILDDAEFYYVKTESGLPQTYFFNIESVGHLSGETIYKTGILKLKERLNNAKNELNNKNSEIVSIHKNKKSDEVYDVIFMKENDTLGNILSEYLSLDKDVKYVGYRLVHPLKYEMHMKFVLNENNNKENIIKKYIETINKILKIVDTL